MQNESLYAFDSMLTSSINGIAGPSENGYVADLSRGSQTVTSGGETWIEVSSSLARCPASVMLDSVSNTL